MMNCYTEKNVLFTLFLMLILLFLPEVLHAQMAKNEPFFIYERSLDLQKKGMIVLGSWAGANLISGGIGFFRSTGNTRYLHQMNAAWNVVNLGIAVFGYRGALQASAEIAAGEMLGEMGNLDRILLINAGLDLLYLGTGAYLWRRGMVKDSNRLTGYGQSLIIQGGFLLLFDAVFYLMHSPLTAELGQITNQLSFTGNGFRVSF